MKVAAHSQGISSWPIHRPRMLDVPSHTGSFDLSIFQSSEVLSASRQHTFTCPAASVSRCPRHSSNGCPDDEVTAFELKSAPHCVVTDAGFCMRARGRINLLMNQFAWAKSQDWPELCRAELVPNLLLLEIHASCYAILYYTQSLWTVDRQCDCLSLAS